jgi:hypothetical protein
VHQKGCQREPNGEILLKNRENPNKMVSFFMLLDLSDFFLAVTKCVHLPSKIEALFVEAEFIIV